MENDSEIKTQLNKIESLIKEQNMLKKEMLTFKEASVYINVSDSHLYKMTHHREVPHFCPNGKKLYFKRSELDQWLQRNRKVSKEELESEAARYSFNNVGL